MKSVILLAVVFFVGVSPKDAIGEAANVPTVTNASMTIGSAMAIPTAKMEAMNRTAAAAVARAVNLIAAIRAFRNAGSATEKTIATTERTKPTARRKDPPRLP